MTEYLTVAQVLELHAMQIAQFGGSPGLRDRGLLGSACARPAMTFAGEELYPDQAGKAAALMHSLVANHAFVDGNKRIGVNAALFFLDKNGVRLDADIDALEHVTLAVAASKIGIEELTIWFRHHVREDK
jgi:death-on-curing protein